MSSVRACLYLTAAALCLIWAALAPAQAQDNTFDLRWRLPKRVYLLFNNAKGEQAQAQAQRKVADKIDNLVQPPKGHFHMFGYEIAQAEKRDQGTGLLNEVCPPLSWEDLLMQLAMYVPGKSSKKGDKYERQWNFERNEGFPAFKMQSNYEVAGAMSFGKWSTCAIASRHSLLDAQQPADESKPFHVWRELTVTCTAHFDTAAGYLRGATFSVRGFSFELGAIAGSVKRFNFFDWDLEWQFAREFDTTVESDLKRFVDAAIVTGRQRLLEMQDKEGMWVYSNHKRGGTALALLALLICGISSDDPKVVAGFEAMKAQEVNNTYEVAVSLMAYEAKYISDDEKRSFLDGRKVEQKRALSPEDRKEMQRLLDWIVANQNKKNPFWNYKHEAAETERFDLSVTQYSLLALGTSLRCGLKIPSGIVRTHVEELRKLQEADGPAIKRVIGGKPPKPGRPGKTETPEEREPRFTRAGKTVKARGWAYSAAARWDPATKLSSAYGSMTCSGLTCLMIALDVAALMTPEQRNAEFGSHVNYSAWQQSAAQSMESGMAWMEVHFSITRNANLGRAWYYYYLYGLERVGVLCDARYIGEHDWYNEGAGALVCLQTPANDWGGAVDTSFALLFLKRGTIPLKTPPPTGEKSVAPITPWLR